MLLQIPARDTAPLDQFSALAQRQAVAARNLVNADELKTWLDELLASRFGSPAENANPPHPSSRQAACERWTHSVARKWMMRQGQTEQHQPQGEALAQSPAWIQHAIANGTPPQRLSLLSSERETLAGVLDWMRSDDGPALASDWSRISVEQAIRSEKAWIDAMAKAALKKDLEAADAAGTTLFADSPAPGPDGRSGWRWVQVQSKEALDREGSLMRHCVGSYADDVAADRKSIYSLRDPDNKPRLTLETQEGKIAQLKAFANQPCPPDLFDRVADFATAFDALCQTKHWTIQTSDEAQEAGLFAVPGLGLAIAGSPPPEDFSARFVADLEEPSPNVDTLPLLASLGWTSLLRLAIPHASEGQKSLALIKASNLGQLPSVELLIPVSDAKANQSEALGLAASSGSLAIVELLLPHSDPHDRNSDALTRACAAGHLAIVKLLLPHSDPQAYDSRALACAARQGHAAIVELLLPHSDPHTQNPDALIAAALNGHLAVVKLMLPYSDPKAKNSAALTCAAENGHLEVAKLLLPLSDPTAANSDALIWAASNGHLAIVELLLPHSDPKAYDSRALAYAARQGHSAIVELLIPLSDPKFDDSRALLWAAKNGHSSVVELLLPVSDPTAGDSGALRAAKNNGHANVAAIIEATIADRAAPPTPALDSLPISSSKFATANHFNLPSRPRLAT